MTIEDKGVSSKEDMPLVNITVDKPWAGDVDRDSVLSEILENLLKYTHLSHEQAIATTLWIRAVYNFNSFPLFMKLLIAAPTKRCGKSTLLECISYMLPKSKMLDARTTASYMEGIISQHQPTLLIDEGDKLLQDDASPLASLILASHKKKSAVIGKSVPYKKGWIAKDFSVWSPIAVAMNGMPIDTLIDRSLSIIMERSDKRIKFFDFDQAEKLTPLREKLTKLTILDNECIEKTDFNSLIKELVCANPRSSQNWVPLLAVAKSTTKWWADECIKAFNVLGVVEHQDESVHMELIHDLFEFVEYVGKAKTGLSGTDMIDALCKLEYSQWATFNFNKERINLKQLKNLLLKFNIEPELRRWDGGSPTRKYDSAKLMRLCELYKK